MTKRRRATECGARLKAATGSSKPDRQATRERLLRREHPDLILLDLIMPGRGWPGIPALACAQSGDDIPVLIVSALDTAKTAVEALQSGAADYIVKGFDIEELRTRVANLAEARRTWRGERATAPRTRGRRAIRADAGRIGGDAARF